MKATDVFNMFAHTSLRDTTPAKDLYSVAGSLLTALRTIALQKCDLAEGVD